VVLILHFTGKRLIWLTYQPSEPTKLLTYKWSFDCESSHNINPLNAELNPICNLLALLAHHILHVSRITVNWKRISETTYMRNLRLHILQLYINYQLDALTIIYS